MLATKKSMSVLQYCVYRVCSVLPLAKAIDMPPRQALNTLQPLVLVVLDTAYGTTTVLKHEHYLGKLYQLEALKMQEKK